MQKQIFRKDDRLTKKREYALLKKQGFVIRGHFFLAVVLPNNRSRNRLGITITRKVVGKSTQRNRIKRLIREFFRKNRHCLEKSWDINIIAKKGAAETSNTDIDLELKDIFLKLSSREKQF